MVLAYVLLFFDNIMAFSNRKWEEKKGATNFTLSFCEIW